MTPYEYVWDFLKLGHALAGLGHVKDLDYFFIISKGYNQNESIWPDSSIFPEKGSIQKMCPSIQFI